MGGLFVKDAGLWKETEMLWVKDAGVWKEVSGGGGFGPSTPLGTFVPEEGGYYIGTILVGSQEYALFLANKAQGQNNSVRFKTDRTSTTGLSDADGWANSILMYGGTLHPAATFCRNLNISGFTDWYLPSRDELTVIYDNRGAIVGDDSLTIDSTRYWSSSQGVTAAAYSRVFSTGVEEQPFKDQYYRCRAVRRKPILGGV